MPNLDNDDERIQSDSAQPPPDDIGVGSPGDHSHSTTDPTALPTPDTSAGPSPEVAPRPASGLMWLLGALAGLSLVGVFVLGFMLLGAHSDRDDARSDLAAREAELDQSQNDLADARQVQVNQEAELRGISDRLAVLEGELAARDDELAAAGLELAEAARTRQGVIDFLALSFGLGAGLEEPDAACVAEALAAETPLAEILDIMLVVGALDTADFTDPELLDLGFLVLKAANTCDIPLDSLGGSLQPGFTYGDNTRLDALWDDCFAGNGAACDDLYNLSEYGSDYERFGATCGERYSVAAAPPSCATAIGGDA